MSKVAIGTEITLNEGEQQACRLIARLRFENNRKKDVKNAKIGDQSDENTDLEGFGAEMAFCRLFNVVPDLSIHTRSSQDGSDGHDVVLPDGKTVDIKATKYETGKLLAVRWKAASVDYYALMIGTFPTYSFRGFLESEELLKPSRLGSLGHGETFIAKQTELKPLEQLGSHNFW